jgi:hypothetical protein
MKPAKIPNKTTGSFCEKSVLIRKSFLKKTFIERLIEIIRQFHHDLLAISVYPAWNVWYPA